jgi:hypothetical protein
MSIDTAHIVFGTCGEYSDRSTWVVRVFASKEAAAEFMQKLYLEDLRLTAEQANALDPRWSKGETRYYVEVAPMEPHCPYCGGEPGCQCWNDE